MSRDSPDKYDDDDDFQNPTYALTVSNSQPRPPLKPSNSTSSSASLPPPKRLKRPLRSGKENLPLPPPPPPPSDDYSSGPRLSQFDEIGCFVAETGFAEGSKLDEDIVFISAGSQVDCTYRLHDGRPPEAVNLADEFSEDQKTHKDQFKMRGGYISNSIESKLLASGLDSQSSVGDAGLIDEDSEDFEPGSQLHELLNLCAGVNEEDNLHGAEFHHLQKYGSSDMALVCCPVCEIDISDLSDELRQVHTNDCLDKGHSPKIAVLHDDRGPQIPQQVVDGSPVESSHRAVDVSPVIEWLHSLGLGRYKEFFVREEIDMATLQWLTEEDLLSMGIGAIGPRKKIVHALSELRRGSQHIMEMQMDTSEVRVAETCKVAANKLITDYFPGRVIDRKKSGVIYDVQRGIGKSCPSGRKEVEKRMKKGKLRDIPLWCCIPGTPFRVDAFRYLRSNCSHWFLTHFHMDHYQGLTRSFCHGKIFCSSITAKLVNMKIGIPWERLQVLPLNQKICIAGIDVTCIDANHCPGSIIILFEPPNGKAVLHTGDFRFTDKMEGLSALQNCPIHTLILDTTYCNPQYDFPEQEAVIQFVVEAIQAEAFNPRTLFLIGSYTIGKERLFLEVARVLRKKIHVTGAKLRLLECLELPQEDMQWFTLNEQESHIHVVPMWTLASFKRLKHVSNQYMGRFSLIIAFSPTGWTFGKGKKKSSGRRWQQGTIIRYEVPYSEHSSYAELKQFVKFLSPANIIPSVNNDGPESSEAMIDLLS